MSIPGPLSERAIILAPFGRDSQIALKLLEQAGFAALISGNLNQLCDELSAGAGLAIVADEALRDTDLDPLHSLLAGQPVWSDIPFVLLTQHNALEQNPSANHLGNVAFLDRPFHPTTLVSLVTSALRGRRRQYEARGLLESELHLQQALKQGTDQLRRLNQTLEQQVEERTSQLRHNEEVLRQSQKMEAIGQLTGGIAHDFNNLLTGIIGSLELLRRRVARGRTEDLDSLIDLGVTSANRAAALTHRLLAYSRRQSLDAKPIQMNDLVSAMGELIQRSLNECIHLNLQLEEQPWTAEADPHQLENALLNLVLNARDAMPEGGQLTVSTFNQRLDKHFTSAQEGLQPGDYVVLSVRDSGCGMPQNVINRAFDPFFTTKPIGQGTGLGLSMIYGFSKQSHGHVSIQSEVGSGTTVCLYLPRFRGEVANAAQGYQSNALYAKSGETVLIVEDDPAVRVLVCEVLGDLGYAFVEASNGDAAVPILESGQRIDLMISDVGLPGMNGRQLAEIGRQLRPGLKVLFITGYAEHAAVRAGFLDSGMQMITKPFAFDHLTAKVREMIEA